MRPDARVPGEGHRVLALVTDAFGGRGGIAQYNRDFLTAVSALGPVAQVHVLPRYAPDAAGVLPARVEQDAPRAGRLAYVVAALRAALTWRPTVVFCGHLYHGPLAVQVSRLADARLVAQMHGIEGWHAMRPIHRRALERADVVLTVSRDTRARVIQRTMVEPERIAVLPDTVAARFAPDDRRASRQQWSFTDADRVLLTVGRMDPRERYKGHELVMDAVVALVAAGVPVRYVIAGTGADRARLEHEAMRRGVAEHVRFVGHVADADLPALYRAADVYAMPSRGEGFGIAFLEAMACGTPAIGLAEGGATDALVDGALGRCVAAADFVTACVDAVRAAPQDAAQRVALAAAVQARFGTAAFTARVAALTPRLFGVRGVAA